ncbi:MAG: ABC transporter substrate-binding protein, partial [Deinococcota bacterium]
GVLPAHIFMPVYEEQGAAGVKALWGVDTDPSEIISGGPYLISEFRPGERLVLEKNPMYGQFVQAADGSPLPGPDTWNITITEDRNAELSLIVTGQANFYWPTTLDEVRAVNEAVNGGTIGGEFFPNISPSTSVDFITYNFNSTDECKRTMFREPMFRQAVSTMIDRDSLVQAAVGGLGFPARDYNGDAAAPFHAPDLPPFEFNPDAGVDMLAEIGFTELNADGILFNPETGCEVAFDLQFNSGNNRRGQLAQVISQTVAPFGVSINPLEVSVDIWQESIVGDLDYDETGERTRDYDAQIWGLAGGDVDNPSSVNVLGLNTNLNSWNKSATDVEDWEVEMSEISYQMDGTLDLDERVALYSQRAQIMRDFLPITPLINQSFHIYTNMSNSWPEDNLDANSIESPYRPSGFRNTLAAPSQ